MGNEIDGLLFWFDMWCVIFVHSSSNSRRVYNLSTLNRVLFFLSTVKKNVVYFFHGENFEFREQLKQFRIKNGRFFLEMVFRTLILFLVIFRNLEKIFFLVINKD